MQTRIVIVFLLSAFQLFGKIKYFYLLTSIHFYRAHTANLEGLVEVHSGCAASSLRPHKRII